MSLNAPGFAALAADLALRLELFAKDERREDAEDARTLAVQGRRLQMTFASWPNIPPSDQERGQAIDGLVSFNREALDLLAGLRHGTDRDPPR